MPDVFFKPAESNAELLDIAKLCLGYVSLDEASRVNKTTQVMLNELDVGDPNFLTQFDTIIFGTIIMTIAILGYEKIYGAVIIPDDLNDIEETRKAIVATSQQLKNGEITLTVALMTHYFGELVVCAPLIKTRLFALVHPIAAAEPVIDAPNRGSSGTCCAIS